MNANAEKPQTKPESKPAPKDDKDSLKTLAMPELMKKLGSSADGLTQAEVQKRLAQYGPNAIEEKKTNIILKFLSYFWGPIPWMIEGAAILSGVVRHWMDLSIILFLLFSNAVVGFWEEHQAGNAIDALKKRLAVNARAKRDGKWTEPKSSELVPGDVIRLRLGDIIPADARLLDCDSVQVDQSALTGESLPVEVKPAGAMYSGSILRQGEIDAMVYATGTSTYFGKTAQLVQSADTISHFQRSVLKIGDYLIALAVAMVLLMVTVALLRHDPVLTTLEFCLVLLVAAIPVAMPTVLSVTMAVGARLLSKKRSGRYQAVRDRGTGRRRHPVFGQDRHPYPKQADLGRSLHLRSTSHVMGYRVWASDGDFGIIEGFVMDEASWHLGYLDVKGGDWLHNRSVLIPTRWIDSVSWSQFRIHLQHTKAGTEMECEVHPIEHLCP